MFENTKECVANCLQTTKETQVMAREFGLQAVDSAIYNPRADIQIQIATYFPTASINDITIEKDLVGEGQFIYTVNLTEAE